MHNLGGCSRIEIMKHGVEGCAGIGVGGVWYSSPPVERTQRRLGAKAMNGAQWQGRKEN